MADLPDMFPSVVAVEMMVTAVETIEPAAAAPDSPNPASQAQKPMVIHLVRLNGLKSICFTRS
jgi:hypothetical protein